MITASLRITAFHDRRTVELHQRHDVIERRRFYQNVERKQVAKAALAKVTKLVPIPNFLRRQAG